MVWTCSLQRGVRRNDHIELTADEVLFSLFIKTCARRIFRLVTLKKSSSWPWCYHQGEPLDLHPSRGPTRRITRDWSITRSLQRISFKTNKKMIPQPTRFFLFYFTTNVSWCRGHGIASLGNVPYRCSLHARVTLHIQIHATHVYVAFHVRASFYRTGGAFFSVHWSNSSGRKQTKTYALLLMFFFS